MLEPLPIRTVRTGTETPKTWLPFMGPAVDPDAHPFGTLQKQDPHRQTLMPDTTTLPGIDHTRDRDRRLGTVILGTEILGTEPYLHLSLVHLNLVRLEPRLARLPPLLLELLQSYIKAQLPESSRLMAASIVDELTLLSRQQISTIKHTVSCSSRSLATGIALRCHAWLHTAHLPDDIKAKVEDLPFDGEGLFHTTTDQYLTSIDDSRKTAKRLGFFSATPSKPKQRAWTPRYQRRHNSPRSTDSWKGKKTYTKPTHQPKGRNQKPKRPDDSTKQSL
ncbi:UNVERIFIED_CONTAM: hypothetical protein K2H54_013723 [Gekko kuhli]